MKTIGNIIHQKTFPMSILDDNEKLLYREYSDGYWKKYKFDLKGYQIYYGDSDGYWVKQKYDSNGTRIYFENSNGLIKDNRL